MRALEVYELLDCGEAIMHAALERKETRGNHVRSDYPLTNPLLGNKFLVLKMKRARSMPHGAKMELTVPSCVFSGFPCIAA